MNQTCAWTRHMHEPGMCITQPCNINQAYACTLPSVVALASHVSLACGHVETAMRHEAAMCMSPVPPATISGAVIQRYTETAQWIWNEILVNSMRPNVSTKCSTCCKVCCTPLWLYGNLFSDCFFFRMLLYWECCNGPVLDPCKVISEVETQSREIWERECLGSCSSAFP